MTCLNEVLKAPLRGVVGFRPLAPNVQEGEVVAARFVEVCSRVVCVYRALLWPVEDGRTDLQHGADGQDLGRASLQCQRGSISLGRRWGG